jgi:hypothetical protein
MRRGVKSIWHSVKSINTKPSAFAKGVKATVYQESSVADLPFIMQVKLSNENGDT